MDFKVEARFQANSLKELRQQIQDFMAEEGFEVGYTIAVSDEPVAKPKPAKAAKSEAKVETAPLEPVMSAEPVTDASPTETEVEPSTSAETASSPSTELTYDDVRKAVLDLASVTGPEKVKETLGTFGLTNAKDADPSAWPQIIEKFVSEAEIAKAAAAKVKGGA